MTTNVLLLFSDTPYSAHTNTLYLSIITITKTYDLNIYENLKILLEYRPNTEMTDKELNQLSPWNESVQEIVMRKILLLKTNLYGFGFFSGNTPKFDAYLLSLLSKLNFFIYKTFFNFGT